MTARNDATFDSLRQSAGMAGGTHVVARVVRVPYSIPDDIRLSGHSIDDWYIEWQYCGGASKVGPSRDGTLEAFVGLHDAHRSPARVRRFVERNGLLGMCEHGKLYSGEEDHFACERCLIAAFGALTSEPAAHQLALLWSIVNRWRISGDDESARHWIENFNYGLRTRHKLSMALLAEERPDLLRRPLRLDDFPQPREAVEDWINMAAETRDLLMGVAYFHAPEENRPLLPDHLSKRQWYEMRDPYYANGLLLRLGLPHVGLNIPPGEAIAQPACTFIGLRGALVSEILAWLSSPDGLVFCSSCGSAYKPQRRPWRDGTRPNYCSELCEGRAKVRRQKARQSLNQTPVAEDRTDGEGE